MDRTEEELRSDTGNIYDELTYYLIGFSELMEEEFQIDIRVDDQALWNVAGSLAQDIKRYKDFHEIEIPDQARRSAYACKWLMRLRPIAAYHSSDDEGSNYFLSMINEAFASFACDRFLDLRLDDILVEKVNMIFQYSLRYRGYCEDTFILLFTHLYQSEHP